MEPLTTHLDGVPASEAARNKDAILELAESPGYEALKHSIALRCNELRRKLEARAKPFDSPAEYESFLGEIRGLESVEALVDGIIQVGEVAQQEINSEAKVGG